MSSGPTGDGAEAHAVRTEVNGEEVTADVEPRLKLSDFLRRRGHRSVRVGCEHGVCGACTVLVDGKAAKSCLMYAVQADERSLETADGLATDGELHPVQEAFHREHALQCGFCTSGFVMSSLELLRENPDPDRGEIREGLADNVCRCTGYEHIFEAVERAAAEFEATAAEVEGAKATDAVGGTTADGEQPTDVDGGEQTTDGGEQTTDGGEQTTDGGEGTDV